MDKVREKLLNVEKLIGSWGRRGVDELERDAVLKTLQDVYTAVKNVPVRDAVRDVDAYVNTQESDKDSKPKVKPSIVHSLYGEPTENPREDAYVNDDINTYADTYALNEEKEPFEEPEDAYVNTYAFCDNKSKSLRQFIALGDRAMMIRTLFKSDEEAFDRAVERLDEFNYLDDAVIFIHDNWQWGAENEGARRLMEILEQKLGLKTT